MACFRVLHVLSQSLHCFTQVRSVLRDEAHPHHIRSVKGLMLWRKFWVATATHELRVRSPLHRRVHCLGSGIEPKAGVHDFNVPLVRHNMHLLLAIVSAMKLHYSVEDRSLLHAVVVEAKSMAFSHRVLRSQKFSHLVQLLAISKSKKSSP